MSPVPEIVVLKLGGSLINFSHKLVKEILTYSDSTGKTVLIVPGGSVFADTVRKVDPSQEAAHWMAVLAMEQYGYYLADGTGAILIDSLDIEESGAYVLLPYHLLKKNDELPHSWDVTSDTIAAWTAKKLGARFIKATDVDGIFIDGVLKKELNASDIIGIKTCVDAALPHFLIRNRMVCEIINGSCPDRLIKALNGDVIGTILKG